MTQPSEESIREQVRRDVEAFARFPQAVQDNLKRELASLGRSPHILETPAEALLAAIEKARTT
jgi:hypothetical protein